MIFSDYNRGDSPVWGEGVRVMRLNDMAERDRIDEMLYGHYSGKGQWLNSLDVDLAWARISFLEGR